MIVPFSITRMGLLELPMREDLFYKLLPTPKHPVGTRSARHVYIKLNSTHARVGIVKS